MGCWASVPHANRRYRDPADLEEYYVPDAEGETPTPPRARDDVGKIRRFGNWRNGQANQPPDDIDGLPSCHMPQHLASNPDILLYEAEVSIFDYACLQALLH